MEERQVSLGGGSLAGERGRVSLMEVLSLPS